METDRWLGNPRGRYATDDRATDCRMGLWRRSNVDPRIESTLTSLVGPVPGDPWWETGRHVQSHLETGMLFALVGSHGGGKSTLAGGIVHVACWRWMRCLMVTATELGMALAAARRSDAGEEGYVERMRDLDLLVIDEWQDRSGTEHEDKIVKELVNQRYGHQRDTLIVSNLRPGDFIRDIGPSMADRMRQCGGVISCDWPSRRVK